MSDKGLKCFNKSNIEVMKQLIINSEILHNVLPILSVNESLISKIIFPIIRVFGRSIFNTFPLVTTRMESNRKSSKISRN